MAIQLISPFICVYRSQLEESLQWLCKLKLPVAVYAEASLYKLFRLCV